MSFQFLNAVELSFTAFFYGNIRGQTASLSHLGAKFPMGHHN